MHDADNDFDLDSLPTEVREALQKIADYLQGLKVRSAEDLVELENKAQELAEEVVRTAAAHGLQNNPNLPQLEEAAPDLIRRFLTPKRQGRP